MSEATVGANGINHCVADFASGGLGLLKSISAAALINTPPHEPNGREMVGVLKAVFFKNLDSVNFFCHYLIPSTGKIACKGLLYGQIWTEANS